MGNGVVYRPVVSRDCMPRAGRLAPRGRPLGAAGSDGQCNSLGQNLGRCLEAESLPRPLVQL